MRRMDRLAATICAAITILVDVCASRPSAAQAPTPPTGLVTIFTDGLSYPGGAISQAVAELSVELDKSGKIRLLSIMGHAGAANLRDLLRFRGADFAILNSDVLASAEIAKSYPGLSEKLRHVTRLRTQKVVLLVRRDIEGLGQLAGKKVTAFGPDGVTGYTARTVLAALGVKAEVTSRRDAAPENELTQADAIFLFASDAKRLPSSVARSADLRPIPIPLNPALAKFYRAAEIQPTELGGTPQETRIATIETDTILASFNWQAQHGRYADVTAFIDGFFGALPRLRAAHPSSIWNETDPRAAVLGWRQYGPAALAAKSVPAPAPAPTVSVPAFASSIEQADSNARLRLSIVPQASLTDEHASGGGLLTQLAKAAVERTDWPQAANVEIRWEKDRSSQAQSLLVDKSVQLALPWSGPNCDEPALLTGETAAICDGALVSDPIFKALVVFFVASGSDFDPNSQERLSGRTLCVPANRAFSPPTEVAARLIQDGQLKLLRPASMIDCLNLVGRGDADALLVNELEGKRAIANLGLSQAFHVVENAGSTEEIRIVVAKSAPKAEELLNALNKGIAKLKTEDVYGEIVMKHVMALNQSAAAR
jgi:polar amino acid transport system substrate-binding protein